MVWREGLAQLAGCSFEVRHSTGVQVGAQGAAEIAADGGAHFRRLFGGVEPDNTTVVG